MRIAKWTICLTQFKFLPKTSEFADGHGEVRDESRDWENSYRSRWQYDKIVRSTHGAETVLAHAHGKSTSKTV